MNALIQITDNIMELLVKIIKFTERRQRVLAGNISKMRSSRFVPRDLDVNRFAELLDYAINEHILNHRLVLYDTGSIKFGKGGAFEARPVRDKDARKLLDKNPAEFLRQQLIKLLENARNKKMAENLLRQKRHNFKL